MVAKSAVRMKRWISDPDDKRMGKPVLFLPGNEAAAAERESPTGRYLHECLNSSILIQSLSVFQMEPFKVDSDESKSFQKYAALMSLELSLNKKLVLYNHWMCDSGKHPFDMFSSARELLMMATNSYVHHPLVDVSWSQP